MADSLIQTQAGPEAPIAEVKDQAAPAPEVKPEPPKETASALLAKLARQRKESMQLNKRVSAADSEKAELLKRIQELEGKVSQKPKDPLEALKSAGFGYEDATNFVLNDSKLTTEQQIAALKKELADRDRTYEEREQKRLQDEREAAQRSVQEQEEAFKADVIDFIEQQKSTYELTSQEDPQEVADTVLMVIRQHFSESTKEWEDAGRSGKRPKALSTKEALDLIEQHLEERASKYYETNKMKQKFGPKTPESEKKETGGTSTSKTLSSAVTSSGTTPGAKIADPVARAMSALERMGK